MMTRLVYLLLTISAMILRRIEEWLAQFVTTAQQSPKSMPEYGADQLPPTPPKHWLEYVQRQPPTHWLEYIQSRAPHLLDSEFEHYVSQPLISENNKRLTSHSDGTRRHLPKSRDLRGGGKPVMRLQRTVVAPHISEQSTPENSNIYPIQAPRTSTSSILEHSTRTRLTANMTRRQEMPSNEKECALHQSRDGDVLIRQSSRIPRTTRHRYHSRDGMGPTHEQSQSTPQPLQDTTGNQSDFMQMATLNPWNNFRPRLILGNSPMMGDFHTFDVSPSSSVMNSPGPARNIETGIPQSLSWISSDSGRWAALIEEDNTSAVYYITQMRSQTNNNERRDLSWNE